MLLGHLLNALALSVSMSVSSPQPPPAQKIVTAAQVNGTWRVKNRTQDNEFRILALGKKRLRIAFEGLYKFRTFDGTAVAHVGTAEGTADIEGDTVNFRPEGVRDCVITMRFARNRLFVRQEGLCDFGLNVTAEGVYRRVSARKPTFDQSMPD